MKKMCKKPAALGLALVFLLGLAAPVLAAGPSFTDVPESYWGYADIEAVAAAGYMNGTGGGAFSPEMKVSVAQFLTLLGRLVFPEVKAEGADWFGPYISAAQEAGLLVGSQVDVNNVEAEISRYDMAMILRAAAKKLGVTEKSAQSSEVTDYGMVPTMYADAVLAVYGMGLIRGDQAGNFNGSNTMMRAEVATVIMRLAKAKPGGSSEGGTTTEPEKPTESQPPVDPEPSKNPDPIEMYVPQTTNTKTFTVNGHVCGLGGQTIVMDGIQVGFFFKDGRLLAQAVTDNEGKWSMEITVDAEDYNYSRNLYYTYPLAPFTYDGWTYTAGGSKDPRSLYEMMDHEGGCPVDVH